MLALFGRTVFTLLVLQLGASIVHARDKSDALRSEAIATVSARVLVLCDVSSLPAPGCPATSLSSTSASLSGSHVRSSPTKADELIAKATVIFNFE